MPRLTGLARFIERPPGGHTGGRRALTVVAAAHLSPIGLRQVALINQSTPRSGMDRAPHLPLNPSRIEVIAGLTDDCQAMIRRSPGDHRGITWRSPDDHRAITWRADARPS